MHLRILFFFIVSSLSFNACWERGKSSNNQGKLGYDCYPDGTCDVPWTCVAGICRNVASNNHNDIIEDIVDVPDISDISDADVSDIPDTDVSTHVCGNNTRENGEWCDGDDVGSVTCVSLGFSGGTLRCSVSCLQYDTSACTTASSSSPTPPAEVLATGSGGLLLRGVVLTPTGVLNPGEVLVVNEYITCVAPSCTAQATNATIIETHGIISPGLIDAHNHQSYNFFPEWVPNPPHLFENRYQWANDPQYEEFILPYTKHRSSNTHFCPGSKWAELRCMAHGTTTLQGQPSASGSCINWGVRNADGYHGLGYDHMHGIIGSVRDIDDTTAATYMEYFTRDVDPITRFHVHMAEGYASNYILDEFDSWAGRDPRPNRHNGVSLLYNGTSILIHSIPLTETQLQEVKANNAKIVWSPSSNMVLYGRTANIQRILQLGILVSVAPDWTISGEDDMLAEMRFARNYGIINGIVELTSRKIWEMATWMAAEVVGLHMHIGRLEAGYRADIAVFGRTGSDPYDALIDSRAWNVRLVLIDGRGFFGDANLQSVTARNAYCENIDACGVNKYICVQDSPTGTNRTNETYVDIRTQLYNILEGIGYPADEQYGRGDELLELWTCTQ